MLLGSGYRRGTGDCWWTNSVGDTWEINICITLFRTLSRFKMHLSTIEGWETPLQLLFNKPFTVFLTLCMGNQMWDVLCLRFSILSKYNQKLYEKFQRRWIPFSSTIHTAPWNIEASTKLVDFLGLAHIVEKFVIHGGWDHNCSCSFAFTVHIACLVGGHRDCVDYVFCSCTWIWVDERPKW